MDRKRRTHPSYLSNDEAGRERRRTEELVRSLVGNTHSTSSVMEKCVPNLVRNQTNRARAGDAKWKKNGFVPDAKS